jgi:hypothetical protein
VISATFSNGPSAIFMSWLCPVYLTQRLLLHLPPFQHKLELTCFSLCCFCYLLVDLHHQHTPGTGGFHSISVPTGFLGYSKVKMKSNGDKAPPCFRSFWIRDSSACNFLHLFIYMYNSPLSFFLTSFDGWDKNWSH